MEMLVGESAPSQQVKIFAVDLVSLRRPTITVTIGNAFQNIKIEMKKKIYMKNHQGKVCIALYQDVVYELL